MPFIIEIRTSSGGELEDIKLNLQSLETKIMATLAEIAAAVESLTVTVSSEKEQVKTKLTELNATVTTLQTAVEQLKSELADANNPDTLEALAEKIASLTGEIAGFVE
jgi:chromosome segregation ATPase